MTRLEGYASPFEPLLQPQGLGNHALSFVLALTCKILLGVSKLDYAERLEWWYFYHKVRIRARHSVVLDFHLLE